jgi:hypothetical protein
MKKITQFNAIPGHIRGLSLLSVAKVVGVIILGGFILGGFFVFGARYIRYEEAGDLFRIGGNLKIEGTCEGCLTSGMVAMFTGPCPPGWTRFSEMDGRFPRGASTYGATGGSTTHSHGAAGDHSHGMSGPSADDDFEDNGDSGAADYHSHTIYPAGSHSHPGASHLPPYRDIVFCKKD